MTPRQAKQDRLLDALNRAIRTVSVALLFVMAITSFYTIGPWAETAFWPVVTKITVDKIEPGPGGTTMVWVHFTKMRNCDYVGVAWYLGDRKTDFTRITIDANPPGGIPAPTPTRPVGLQSAGPWRVWVAPEFFQSTSFGEVFHRCHPFWTTRSLFHP